MSVTRDVLKTVLAKDLMSENVISVNSAWGITALARFFIENNISGAPVVNASDELMGVVTATDIVEFENKTHKEKVELTRSSFFEEVIGQKLSEDTLEALSLHATDNCTTQSIMTPNIISVAVSDSLIDVAALMSKNKIHRVFVLGTDGNIVGVISTMDVLSHLGGL